MENWPENVLLNIFEFLGLEDLVNVRDVCKRFQWICSNKIEIDELVISSRNDDYRGLWGFSEKPIYYRDAINLNEFRSLTELFAIAQHLRRLHVREFSKDERLHFDCSILTHFVQLQQLDLEALVRNQAIVSTSLLVITTLPQNCLVLKTPNLMGFKCKHVKQIDFDHPEMLRVLETTDYPITKHELFPNLECLILEYGGSLNGDTLSIFKNLRELRIHNGDTGRFDLMKEALINIFKQKLVLRRLDFKVFIQGVEICDLDWFFGMFHGKLAYQFMVACHLNNAKLLCSDLSYYTKHNYNKLMEQAEDRLPADFTDRFYNIREVTVSGKVRDENHLIAFLKSVNLEGLYIMHSVLGQSFFDQLTGCQQLRILAIVDNTKLNLNFDFLLHFKLLEEFVTNQRSVDLVTVASKALECQKYLKSFEATCKNFIVKIKKKEWSSSGGYSVELDMKSDNPCNTPNKFIWGQIDLFDLICVTRTLGHTITGNGKFENNF